MEQLDAALAAWRDATSPLDAKASADHSVFLPAASAASEPPDAEKSAPSCRPWSHADFADRAASFAIATWFAKPASISALESARHGWRHSGRSDELRCDCCKQVLCFEIDAQLSEEGAQRMADAYAAMLASGHSALCPWRDNPSPAAFTTLPIASLEQVREALVKRVERALAACASDSALLEALGALRIDAQALARVVGREDADAGSSSSRRRTSLAAALVCNFGGLVVPPDGSGAADLSRLLLHVAVVSACGWELDAVDADGDAGVARCEICNRRWRVASYATAPRSESSADSDAGGERAAKRQKAASADFGGAATALVDPVAQHRWFCPWVTARRQEASHELGVASDDVAKYGENDAQLWEFMLLPGWQQYAQALNSLASVAASEVDTQEASRTPVSPAMVLKERAARPERALESVRAVLGLPEW
ncbi:hypothetical protein PybrP1_011473 [[Pythium] brassicae (nom. inval.)]|nr:hypothetical protein PybrP1_011473 [[Pythium] brassicae (nom. inval.)]